MGFFDKPEVIGPGGDQARLIALEGRVAALEALVQRLTQQPAAPAYQAPPGSLAPEQDWIAEVQRLKQSGKAIAAIKLYRERTGVGLTEAKHAVDAM